MRWVSAFGIHRLSMQNTYGQPPSQRGYGNPNNYRLRIVAITEGLNAFTHTQL